MLNGFCPSYDNPGYRYAGPYAARTKSQRQNTHFYNLAERISIAEHGKLVAESSEFHLTLNRAHREHFSSSKYATTKKRDILSEKLESGMGLKKREFTPESCNVDTYEFNMNSALIALIRLGLKSQNVLFSEGEFTRVTRDHQSMWAHFIKPT